jgi:hypothetical protein
LKAGTKYAFRLDSPITSYVSGLTYKTMTRSVAIDYTTVFAVDDGDAWPNGCGDFIFVFRHDYGAYYATYGETCVSSGTSGLIKYGQGEWSSSNFKENTVREEFYAWDDDVDCWGANCYSSCSSPHYFDVNCGDMASGVRNLDVTKAGTRPVVFAATGVGSSVLVYAYGTLTVSFSP